MTIEQKALDLATHIEMDHERELAFGEWKYQDLWTMHHTMHVLHDHWDHDFH